ncbi:MAG: hypothetical protein DMG96_11075 [Acidobacteria bacterium]|nr:MAG: hypothetical protein DMG98_11345 [Acidobacteriota bacterium]PYV77446.1 MAG: hypothetical protein DMG96_11075 [Acidobacteriota bacterium]
MHIAPAVRLGCWAFGVAYAVFEIPGGWMADRFGPRMTLTRIVLWWSAFIKTCLRLKSESEAKEQERN